MQWETLCALPQVIESGIREEAVDDVYAKGSQFESDEDIESVSAIHSFISSSL